MRTIRAAAAGAVVMSLALAVTACGGGSSTDGGGSDDSPKELTYWASNQGASIEIDKKVLQPELDKFEKETGIKVKLEVVPWSDLLNRILTATTSGQGPDVLNIGNTWSASLQATGGLLPWDDANFAKIGGKDRFVESALGSTGARGQDPAAVPLYSMAYALYYNKQLLADAGISGPPATWDQLVADGKKIQAKGKQVLGAEGANVSENVHHVFTFAKQHGADFFTADGKPDFTSDGAVSAVKQYVDLMAKDKAIPEGNAEYAQNQSVSDFAKGRTAFLLWQSASANLKSQGMDEDKYGIAPVPVRSGTPGTGAQVNSMVAGDQPGRLQELRQPRRRHEVREVHDERRGAEDPQQGLQLHPAGRLRAGGPGLQHPRQRRPEGHPRQERRRAPAGRRRVAVRDGGRYGSQGAVRRSGRRTGGDHRVGEDPPGEGPAADADEVSVMTTTVTEQAAVRKDSPERRTAPAAAPGGSAVSDCPTCCFCPP